MKNEIRVFLIDDHQVVREGLQHMLEQEEDMVVVGQNASGEEVMSQVERLSPDIILMDIKMPGTDGIELTRQLREKQFPCSIIMLTLYDEYLAEAIEAGASGYLLKDAKRTELAHAIRQVHQGEMVISESITVKSRTEYEERFGKKAGTLGQEHNNLMPEEVQMVIPPPADANQLIRFVSRVEEIFQSRVLQMVGSWKGDTAITITLPKPTPFANILDRLEEMPEVGAIGDNPLAVGTDPGLFKKVATIPRPIIRTRRTIFVTLKNGEARG
ncbi:response regulator transcription factor [Chloroflexota bacterium]